MARRVCKFLLFERGTRFVSSTASTIMNWMTSAKKRYKSKSQQDGQRLQAHNKLHSRNLIDGSSTLHGGTNILPPNMELASLFGAGSDREIGRSQYVGAENCTLHSNVRAFTDSKHIC